MGFWILCSTYILKSSTLPVHRGTFSNLFVSEICMWLMDIYLTVETFQITCLLFHGTNILSRWVVLPQMKQPLKLRGKLLKYYGSYLEKGYKRHLYPRLTGTFHLFIIRLLLFSTKHTQSGVNTVLISSELLFPPSYSNKSSLLLVTEMTKINLLHWNCCVYFVVVVAV